MTNNKQEFNPIKEDKDGVIAKRMVWTTNTIDLAIKGLEDGRKLVANPFYENNTKLLKGDLVFQRTDEEIAEWKKCAKDIIYFVNKYCKLMTPQGIKNVTLRDYQENYLKHLMDNRLSIYLACRQCGKCVFMTTNVTVKIEWEKQPKDKKRHFRKYFSEKDDCYIIPMFELYNLYTDDILWKIEYQLYKMLYKFM